jgi:hypothetical protein
MMASFCQNKMAKGDVCKGDTGAAGGGMTNDGIGMTKECRSPNDEVRRELVVVLRELRVAVLSTEC